MGTPKFLAGIQAADWPEKHCHSLENLFYIIENHEKHVDPHVNEALLMYTDCIRQHWHCALRQDKGYEISVLNKKLLSYKMEELRGKHADKTLPQVSHLVLQSCTQIWTDRHTYTFKLSSLTMRTHIRSITALIITALTTIALPKKMLLLLSPRYNNCSHNLL